MRQRFCSLALLVLVIALNLNACAPSMITMPPPAAPGLAGTLAAQTMQADLVLKALLETVTPTRVLETSQPINAVYSTSVLPSSATAVPSLTPISGNSGTTTQMGGAISCNQAEFVRDVTIPDDSIIPPGASFTKIWQFKNTGSCTWTTEYFVVRIWGEALGTENKVHLMQTVAPGELIDLAIEMIAPKFPDCYQSNWMLQDPLGNQFGTGAKGREFFWVAISVWSPNLGIPLKTG